MTVTTVEQDLEALTLTVIAEFDAGVERVWQLWADPRKLERWWGPPTYPGTFVDHDFTVGAVCTYFMTGPEGDTPHGWWKVLEVNPPRMLKVQDGFGDHPDRAAPGMPTTVMTVQLQDRGDGGTTAVIVSEFNSVDQLQQLLDMGMMEGMRLSMEQMDGVLANIPA